MAYDFDEFINEIGDMSYFEMMDYAQQEAAKADKASQGRGGREAREAGCLEYSRRISQFCFYIVNLKMLKSDNEDFETYRMIVERLVKKNQLKPEALDFFK